jgi:hypothetical protein
MNFQTKETIIVALDAHNEPFIIECVGDRLVFDRPAKQLFWLHPADIGIESVAESLTDHSDTCVACKVVMTPFHKQTCPAVIKMIELIGNRLPVKRPRRE